MPVFKRSLLIISIFATAISLTSCGGAGNNAPTRMINQVTDGVEIKVNSGDNLIYVRNLMVVTKENGDAALTATIVNQKPTMDALIAVSIDGKSAALGSKTYAVNQNKPVIFGGESANATATLAGANLVAGSHVRVKLFFGLAGEAITQSLVVDTNNTYAK